MPAYSHKSNYSTPRKGTKRREAVLRLLNPKGISYLDVQDLFPSAGSFGAFTNYLEDECGFHIEIIDKIRLSPKGRYSYIYRIIGRYSWKGKYRSFL